VHTYSRDYAWWFAVLRVTPARGVPAIFEPQSPAFV
jgi:hypothetical protein